MSQIILTSFGIHDFGKLARHVCIMANDRFAARKEKDPQPLLILNRARDLPSNFYL